MPYETLTASDGGTFNAFYAPAKASGPAPGLVLIQEIFGVNKVMRDLAVDLAADGYHVLCPDIFWRIEPGIDITDQTQAEWDKAFELFGKFDVDAGVGDLIATAAHLRSMEGCTGKVGSIGYCLGGKLAYLMATRSTTDANVSYYGVGLDELLGEKDKISKPYLSHIAEKDGFVPPEAQEKIKAGLGGLPMVTLHSYPGQDHAFARIGGAHFDVESAGLANGRTAAFFKEHLA